MKISEKDKSQNEKSSSPFTNPCLAGTFHFKQAVMNSSKISYSVINKEGHKVLGYKTIKKCDFDAFKRFIASKNRGHFDI